MARRSRNGLDVADIHRTPIGTPVLVYRTAKENWDGSFLLPDVNGEDVTLLTARGPMNFRTTVVKQFLTPRLAAADEQIQGSQKSDAVQNDTIVHLITISHADELGELDSASVLKVIVRPQYSDNERFSSSCMMQFNMLVKRGVFSLASTLIADGFRTHESRFVDEEKNAENTSAYKISLFVVQVYNASQHHLLTHAPTVQRVLT